MRIRNAIKIVFHSVFFKVKSIFLSSRVSISFLQLLSYDTHLEIMDQARIKIGRLCSSRRSVDIIAFGEGEIIIGGHCFFNKNVSISANTRISIGENSTFGQNVVIVDHNHDYKYTTLSGYISEPISIGNNVWVGANSIILKGVHIGNNAVVAAACVVTEDVPENTIVIQKRESSCITY